MVRQIKRKWRRFYRTHREGCELVGDFIGAVSIFVFLFGKRQIKQCIEK